MRRIAWAVVFFSGFTFVLGCSSDDGDSGDGDSGNDRDQAIEDCIDELKDIARETGQPAGSEDEVRRACEAANP